MTMDPELQRERWTEARVVASVYRRIAAVAGLSWWRVADIAAVERPDLWPLGPRPHWVPSDLEEAFR